MKSGPRALAVAVLAAVTLLPKTGWIVRNQADVLSRGWAPFGADLGLIDPIGLIPKRLFWRKNFADPKVKAVMSVEDSDFGRTYIRPIDRLLEMGDDPVVRGPLLRQSFTTVMVCFSPSADRRVKRLSIEATKKLLPFALAGERDHPGNAFYAASSWAILSAIGQEVQADEALKRAANGTHYDDEAIREADIVTKAIEAKYGYRGQIVPLTANVSVLLPEYAAFVTVAKRVAGRTSLSDPRRRDIIQLGETMARTSQLGISVAVGRSLILQAIGEPIQIREHEEYGERFAAFSKANPDYHVAQTQELCRRAGEMVWPDLSVIERPLSSPAIGLGAGLLFATIASLAATLPAPRGMGNRRRLWWTIPTAFAFCFSGVSGWAVGAVLVAALLAVSVKWLPAKGRLPVYLGVLLWLTCGVAAFGLRGAGTSPDFSVPILALLAAFGLGRALPLQRDAGWLPAALAVLYVGSVAWMLQVDAQQGEVVGAMQTEGSRFWADHGTR